MTLGRQRVLDGGSHKGNGMSNPIVVAHHGNGIAIGLDSVVNREIIKAFSNHPNVQIQALAEKLLSAVLSGWERKSNIIACYLGRLSLPSNLFLPPLV